MLHRGDVVASVHPVGAAPYEGLIGAREREGELTDGLLLLPYTTLLYVLAWTPVGGVSGWGWLIVALGFFCDLGHLAGGAVTGRQRYA